MTPKELTIRQRLRTCFKTYAGKCLWIKSKEGKTERLVLNRSQLYLHEQLEKQLKETGMIRALVLKGRQQGVSTYTEARYYWKVTHRKGVRAFILTHEDAATQNLFDMVERYHNHCPPLVRPQTSAANAKELTFGKLDSGYKIGTAGTRAVGRSSTVQYFHGCLGGDTPVIDPETDTLIPLKDVRIGQKVRTHTGQIAEVSFVSTQDKLSVSMSLRGYGKFPLVATMDHKFWTKNGWTELASIAVGERIGFPVARITDAVYLLPFRQPDLPRPQGGGSAEAVTSSVALTYDLGRLVGLYLAEGTVKCQRGSGTPSSTIFSVHDDEAARTEQWLESSFNLYSSVKTRSVRGCKTTHVAVYGRSFATFMAELVGRVDGKHLPLRWREMGASFCRGLLHGYLAGDGHVAVDERRIRATSVRVSITLGMRDLAASLGYGWASVEYKEAGTRHGRKERKAYIFSLCGVKADNLMRELGYQPLPRKQKNERGNRVEGGYAWVVLNSLSQARERTVVDLEIDHPDHSFCLLQAASANSEVGFWPHADSHFAGIMQAIPHIPGTEVVLESTANGAAGRFYEMWQDAEKGKGEYIAIFMPWFWQLEYSVDPRNYEFSKADRLLAEKHGLSDGQLAWRQMKIRELKSEDLFFQEYPCTAEEAFLTSGRPAFDPKAMMLAERECYEPSYKAQVSVEGNIYHHSDGPLKVWDDPVQGKRYAIGADVAEGLLHGDYSCAQVLLLPDGLQVAEWHGHMDPDMFGLVLIALGKRYNKAFIGVERNNHGLTTLTAMRDTGYANLYVQYDIEHRSGERQTKKLGWLTTRKSKSKIIDQLASELRDEEHGIVDVELIAEMRRYQIDDSGAFGAQEGYHDDRVMARAIAGEMLIHAPRNRLLGTHW